MPVATRGDLIDLPVWAGNFYVMVPVRVDWAHGQFAAGEHCFEMAGAPGLVETGCEMHVQAERKAVNGDLAFVRLFQEAKENAGNVRHVVLKNDSKVEYLAAKAMVTWSGIGDLTEIHFVDLWLKVMMNNDEENLGWIHTDEDFSAVGLPSQSPPP